MFLCMTQGPLLSPLQMLRLCWQVFHVAKGRAQPLRACSADLAWAPVLLQVQCI